MKNKNKNGWSQSNKEGNKNKNDCTHNVCFFMENGQKLSLNYHQIPSLSTALIVPYCHSPTSHTQTLSVDSTKKGTEVPFF